LRAALSTTEKRRPSRKTLRKRRDSPFTRRNSHHFSTISAHEITESRARMPRTTFAMGPELVMRSMTLELA
jgi:hypothetical protein